MPVAALFCGDAGAVTFTPVPKPPKRKPKARRPMQRHSAKKRQPVPYAAAAVPKGERVRDPEHLDRVRWLPCSCSAMDAEHCGGWPHSWGSGRAVVTLSEAAHVTNKGWGGGDDTVIALCPNHHRLLACSWHVAGRVRFQKMFGFNAAKLARSLYDETLRLRGKSTP